MQCSVRSQAPPKVPPRSCSEHPTCSSRCLRPGACHDCGRPCPYHPRSTKDGTATPDHLHVEDVRDEDIEEQRRTGRSPAHVKHSLSLMQVRSMQEALPTEPPRIGPRDPGPSSHRRWSMRKPSMEKASSQRRIRSMSEEDREEHRSSVPDLHSQERGVVPKNSAWVAGPTP